MKASEDFVEFMKNTAGYEFDCPVGIFYEEHIFSEKWFQNGGIPDGLGANQQEIRNRISHAIC